MGKDQEFKAILDSIVCFRLLELSWSSPGEAHMKSHLVGG